MKERFDRLSSDVAKLLRNDIGRTQNFGDESRKSTRHLVHKV
jgi:hypothetical protein